MAIADHYRAIPKLEEVLAQLRAGLEP